MRIPEPVLNEDFYMVKRIGGDVTLPAPRTRFEELLFIYAGGTIERPTPKTVEERFLDYITGGESELPTPKTRLQSYMYNVANPSNKIPVVPPKTRFECYWFVMATANAIISTDNPVEFTSLDGFLLDYTIWGNTEQDLSEIEISNAFVDGYSIDDQTGAVISEQGHVAILNPVTLMNGTYYVDYTANTEQGVTCRYSVFDGDELVEIVTNDSSSSFSLTLTDNYLVYFSLYPATASIIDSFTITTSDGQICPSPDYHFDIKGVGDYSTNIMPDILYGVQLNYSTGSVQALNTTNYATTDFFTCELSADKYLSLTCVPTQYNTCLFVYSTDNSFIGRTSSSAVKQRKINSNSYLPVPGVYLTEAGTYHVKIGFLIPSGTTNFDALKSAHVMLDNSEYNYTDYRPKNKYIIQLLTTGQENSRTVTNYTERQSENQYILPLLSDREENRQTDIDYTALDASLQARDNYTERQPEDENIEPLLTTRQENSQSTANYIALDTPLQAIDNYADSVNYLSQKETRKVKKLVVDGTNVKFSDSYISALYRYGVGITLRETENPISKVWSNIAIFSEYSPDSVPFRNIFTARQASRQRIYLYFPKNYVNIESPSPTQIENFLNNKAQELYSNGTPIIFYYVPSTSEETPVEIPKIQTYAPKTELTVDTEVQPSKIEVVTRTE